MIDTTTKNTPGLFTYFYWQYSILFTTIASRNKHIRSWLPNHASGIIDRPCTRVKACTGAGSGKYAPCIITRTQIGTRHHIPKTTHHSHSGHQWLLLLYTQQYSTSHHQLFPPLCLKYGMVTYIPRGCYHAWRTYQTIDTILSCCIALHCSRGAIAQYIYGFCMYGRSLFNMVPRNTTINNIEYCCIIFY